MRFLLAAILFCVSTAQASGYRYGGGLPYSGPSSSGTYVCGFYLQPGESLKVIPVGYEVRQTPMTVPCIGCNYRIEEGSKFCRHCGHQQGIPDTKPAELTFGMLLRALDDITDVHTDIIDGLRCKHVTVTNKSRFKEWKELQKDSGGEYIFLHQQKGD